MRRLTTVSTLTCVLAAALALSLAPAAFADGPVATGGDAGASPPQSAAPPPPLGGDPAMVDSDGQPMAIGACGPTRARADGSPDQAAHGAVEVGVGTNGYRNVAGTVCKPIGDAGSISVSVGDSQYGDEPRRR